MNSKAAVVALSVAATIATIYALKTFVPSIAAKAKL